MLPVLLRSDGRPSPGSDGRVVPAWSGTEPSGTLFDLDEIVFPVDELTFLARLNDLTIDWRDNALAADFVLEELDFELISERLAEDLTSELL